MTETDKKNLLIKFLRALMKWLEEGLPDVSHKNRLFAGIWGLVLGGIGLGFYFRSWRDFLYPIVFTVFLTLILPVVGFFLGVIVAIGWGVLRADGWPYDPYPGVKL